MMLALGMFVFALPTLAYDELQRRVSWKHPGTPRVGARDAVQFTGPGDDTISISGTAFAELSDGRASIDQLYEMGDSGEVWSLVDGTGRVYGAFVITGIDERQKHFFADGTARQIDFGLDLLRVDQEDEGAAGQTDFGGDQGDLGEEDQGALGEEDGG